MRAHLRDGSRLYGTIQSQTDETIVFRDRRSVSSPSSRSRSHCTDRLRFGTEIQAGRSTDGVFRATARSLPRGQVYFGLTGPAAVRAVGVTDRFSFGGMLLMFGSPRT